MKEKKLTIPEVSRLTGLTDSTIRSIISRKNKTVALEVAFKIAKGLNVPIEELNGDKNISDKNKVDYMISSQNEEKLIEVFTSLTPDSQEYLLLMAKELLNTQEKLLSSDDEKIQNKEQHTSGEKS